MQSSNSRKGRRALSLSLQALGCLLAAGVIAYALVARGGASSVVLDNPDGSRATLDMNALGAVPLLEMKSGRAEPVSFDSARTLVVFLSGGDCSNCLAERSVWEDLARSHDPSQLRVVGVLVRTSPSEARTFADAYNLSFPLHLDGEGRLGEGTALPQSTPFKVLINGEGKVLLAAGPNPDISTHKDFGDMVVAQLESARVGGATR
ncbi:MAG: redoxin domain-containing protein [Acidobacteria bacterium]|nr:redoxin domain-containing protein [Acidobacteriota bacterium]